MNDPTFRRFSMTAPLSAGFGSYTTLGDTTSGEATMDAKGFADVAASIAPWAAFLAGFVMVWLQNRAAKQLTCLQLFVGLAAQYDATDFQACRANLAAKLLSRPEALDLDDRLLVFYENVAILNRKRILDQELLANTFAIDVCGYWHATKHYVENARSTFEDATLFSEFEALKCRFEKQDGYLHPSRSTLSAADRPPRRGAACGWPQPRSGRREARSSTIFSRQDRNLSAPPRCAGAI